MNGPPIHSAGPGRSEWTALDSAHRFRPRRAGALRWLPLCIPLWLVLGTGCDSGAASGPRVRVFASSSFALAFEALEDGFESANPGWDLEVHVAGTPTLVLQLESGVSASVFASSSEEHMHRVQGLGLLAEAPRVFARNRMAIAVAPGNPEEIRGLEDLARADLTVALCGPKVPAGRYAREILAGAGVRVDSVSDESSVMGLLAKIRLGEVDAGLVYVTDGRTEGVDCIALPPEVNLRTPCTVASLAQDPSPGGGEAFVSYLLSGSGRACLAEFGFESPEPR